jgi:hypothetical protein
VVSKVVGLAWRSISRFGETKSKKPNKSNRGQRGRGGGEAASDGDKEKG